MKTIDNQGFGAALGAMGWRVEVKPHSRFPIADKSNGVGRVFHGTALNSGARTLCLLFAFALGVAPQPACSLGYESQHSAGSPNELSSIRWATPNVEEVLPGVWRVRFGTAERFTPNTVRESVPRLQGFKSLPAPTPVPFAPEQIRCRISPSRTTVYVPCEEPGEQVYGFGLDPGAYQQKGLCKNLTVCAAVVGETGASHGPVPFYLSTKGYGVFGDPARVPMVEVARLTPNQSAAADEPQIGRAHV